MRLLTEIEPEHHPLPDHIELGVRIAGMKMEDARRMQQAAALNSAAVRFWQTKGWAVPEFVLSATERHAAEQYAYARYLMGIDDYWLTIPHTTTKERLDYTLA